MAASSSAIDTQCCIAGGGPAGLMLGYLLARAGIETVVLEKHADFLRDFRGDTIHPSTMEVMNEIGILDDFLKLPHNKLPDIVATFGEESLRVADFSRLPVAAPYIAMMPQWDFLDFLAAKARAFANFKLMTLTAATGLVREGDRVSGVRAKGPDGETIIRAHLSVAADGRSSDLRAASGLKLIDLGAPMDVLWFRLTRKDDDTDQTQGKFLAGRIFIMLNRGDYWQCAYVIPKGSNEKVRAAGLAAFRDGLKPALPIDPARAEEITNWDQVKLLSVQVNRLATWWLPGFLCIGDAAHAMSPIGGVGVNLAIQDAVAAANVITGPLTRGERPGDDALAAVQARRLWPTKITQAVQVAAQARVIAPALESQRPPSPPLLIRMVTATPGLRQILPRLIGLGVRPEHVSAELRSVFKPAA